MTTIQKILLPTDFSDIARTAYEYALSLAEQFKASIDVVHVYTPIDDGIPMVYPDKVSALSRTHQLQDFVTQSMTKEDSKGNIVLRHVPVNAELICGLVTDTIVDLTKKDYDLVVMGSTGGGVFAETIFGSITTKVAQMAYCPVLVLPPSSRYNKVKHLLYACDFAHKSFKHPALIADVAELFKAKVDLIYVEAEEDEQLNDKTDTADMIAVFHTQAPKLKVTAHIVEEEDVFYGINEFIHSHKMDMVVMITKHYTTVEKMFHSSTTKEMAMYTDLPLLVLKAVD